MTPGAMGTPASRCSRRWRSSARQPRPRRAMTADPNARQSLTAVYAGSFDPITNGHVDIIERTLQVFERVIVSVAFNANKDSALFTPAERVEMIDAVFREYGGRVLADSF